MNTSDATTDIFTKTSEGKMRRSDKLDQQKLEIQFG